MLHPPGVAHPGASLLPKVRDHFAEFLNQGSLVRLGLLDLSTGVGVRYGRWVAPQVSLSWPSRCRGLSRWSPTSFVLASRSPAGVSSLPTSLKGPRLPPPRPPRHRAWVKRHIQRCRNLHLLSIAYALPPRLRPDSPAADCPGSGILGYSAVGVLAPRIVTHPDIRTRLRSPPAPADGSLLGDAPLPRT